MKALVVVVLVAAPCVARAADSSWQLCDDGTLAVNLLEHRAADGKGRETSLTLILGERLFVGTLGDDDTAPVVLKSTSASAERFSGTVRMDYARHRLTLRGTLKLADASSTIRHVLACKELQARRIP